MLNKTCMVERVWGVQDTWNLAPASRWLAGTSKAQSGRWWAWFGSLGSQGRVWGADLSLGGEHVGMGAVRWRPSRGVILGD